jgi:PST family polysaccharide transporter
MLVMTWWIGPHDYGLFVAAIGLVAFLSTLARAGVDTYLVRREAAPDERVYDIASTLILCISIGLALAGAAVTPLLIRWYGSGEFVAPYLVSLLNIPITGLVGVPIAKLERELNFRRVAGIELGGQCLGLLVATILAWSGGRVWAPVAGQLTWQFFTLIAACVSTQLVPRLRFNASPAREMLTFGVGITASLRTWQLRTLANPLLVGRFAGAEAVAFVALAIRIAEALGTFRLAAGRMAFAGLARLHDRSAEFRSALQGALYLQVITLGPLLCAFGLLGPLLFRHIIGARWMPSLTVYPFIAAGVLVNSVYNLQASALFVLGRQWAVMRSYIAHVVLLGGGTWLLLPRLGVVGYGWAELLACIPYFLIHKGLAEIAAISYGQIRSWLIAFLSLLLVPLMPRGWFTLTYLAILGSAALLRFGGALLLSKHLAPSRRDSFSCPQEGP